MLSKRHSAGTVTQPKRGGSFIGFACLTSIAFLIPCGAMQGQTFTPVAPLSFVKTFGGTDPLPQIIEITAGGSNFDFNRVATTNSGGNWLSTAAVGFNCCATPRAITVLVTTSASMPVGTYTGQITFTAFNNPSVSMLVPVSLTVQPAGSPFFNNIPGQLSFTLKTLGTKIANRTIQVVNGGGGTLNWAVAGSTADGGNWLTVSPGSGTAPSLVTVGVTVSNLPASGGVPGKFTGQLVFTQASGGSVTVPVSVVVDTNSFSQINRLSFSKVFGGSDPLPQVVTVPSNGANFNIDTDVYTSSGGSWLKVVPVGFNCCTTPRAVNVVVTTNVAMPVGTYAGEIVFTGPEGNGAASMTVPVTLTVEPTGGAFFNNLPGQLSFALETSGARITSQAIQVLNGGQGNLNWTVAKTTADGGDWLTVSVTSGTAPSEVNVGISVANLPGGGVVPGQFIGELVFFNSGGGTVTVPVTVVVGNNIFRQVNGIGFEKVFGGSDPLPQVLTVPSTGNNFNFDTNWYTSSGGNWLKVVAVGFNCCATPRAVNVVVTTDVAMPVGTYTGEIVFTGPEINGASAITVPVTLTVKPAGAPFFNNVPGHLAFSLKTQNTKLTNQTFQLVNGGQGSLDWSVTASTADGGDWLTVSPGSGTAPSLVTVGVVVGNLPNSGGAPGQFIGQLVFSQAGGGSVTVPVSVVVGADIFRQVNGISFTKVFGGKDPLPEELLIASTGTNFNFDTNVYTSSGGAWLKAVAVGFNCCTTPRAVTAAVMADPTLPVGTYAGEIVFTGPEGNGGSAITVPVTLTIVPPTATFIDDVQGGMSFSFTPGAGDPAMQEVQLRKRGPGTLDWTLDATTSDGGNWLTVSAMAGTFPATVQVGVAASALPSGGLVAGSFVGELVFRSAGSTATIPVSVTVGANVYVQLPAITFTKPFGGANPPSKDVTIASTGNNYDFDHNWYTATGSPWLSVTVAGFNCCATPRAITANIVAGPSLPVGTYTGEIVTTVEGNGSSAMTIPVILTVTGSTPPTITSVTPNSGQAGQTLTSVAIVGLNTHFVQGTTTASFGAGITVNSLTVTSATTATANISIAGNAAVGTRTVTLTTGAEAGMLANGFTVTGVPAITSVTPNSGQAGQTLTSVAIVGLNTHFVQGTTTASFGAGITVNSLTVTSATTATANISIAGNAAVGTRTVTLTTGAEAGMLANGFTVTGVPAITSVTPNSGQAGQTLTSVAIVGQNTHFVQGTTTASFGAGITVNSLTVTSATTATANISIAGNAAVGTRTVTLTTGAEAGMLANGFTVTGVPAITSVTPNSGQAGQTLTSVAIVGQNTHFVQGTTTASFGAGITVNSLTVTSATTATANISIAGNAAAGTRTVTLTTGAEVGMLANGFTVTGVPAITSVTPNSGQAGQTLTSVAIVGLNTHFVQGTTTASFGAGITVNSLTVTSATTATANISIAGNAAAGTRTVTLTTGAEAGMLANGFTVTGVPAITSVTPNSGQAGQTLTSVAIVGLNTHFVQGTTTASFGAGITVDSLTVTSATTATANISIAGNAAAGTRTVTLTTGAEAATLANGFTVTGAPAITSVTPNSGQAGQTLTSVAIVGQNTHFVQGTTTASFGAGITVNSLTVTSATTATANIIHCRECGGGHSHCEPHHRGRGGNAGERVHGHGRASHYLGDAEFRSGRADTDQRGDRRAEHAFRPGDHDGQFRDRNRRSIA